MLKVIETRQAQLQQQSIQAKLTSDEPADQSKLEADMMNNQVLSTPERESSTYNQPETTLASLPALPSLIPSFVLKRVGSAVSQKLLWQTFWQVVIKRFGIRGATAAESPAILLCLEVLQL
ncbi:MAG TPA: hypothetical protein VK203_30350 [Nostocaceae cyanobacterium]|nr:hypothetical protein [Nostocaceae cyanobacterium]